MAFNKVLVCVVFCLALVAVSSVCEAQPFVRESYAEVTKRQANPPCPNGYFYNERKGECTNSLLIAGGK